MADYAKIAVEIALQNNQYLAKLAETKNQTEKFAKTTSSLFSGLGSLIGIGAIAGAFYKISEETTAAQKAQAQLGAVLKSTGGAAGVSAGMANDLAEKMKKLTGIDDDVVLSAENVLLTFTNIKKNVFPQTTEAVLDLSVAMGKDLNSSAVMVGKALQNPIQGLTALQKVGVTFSAQQEKQIANFIRMGDVASAQKVILSELNKEFGGSAAAQLNTWGGAISVIKNTLGDFAKTIGNEATPGLILLAKTFGQASDNGQGLQRVIKKIGELGNETFARLSVTVAALNLAFTRAGTGWDRLFNKGGPGTELWEANQKEIKKAEKLLDEATNDFVLMSDRAIKKKKEVDKSIGKPSGYTIPEDKEGNKAAEAAAEKLKKAAIHMSQTIIGEVGKLASTISGFLAQESEQRITHLDNMKTAISAFYDWQAQKELEAAGLSEQTGSQKAAKELQALNKQYSKTASVTQRKNIKEQIIAKQNEARKLKIEEEAADKKQKLDLVYELLKRQMMIREFRRNQAMQMGMATISFATALIAGWAGAMQLPFPASIIIGILTTAILSAAFATSMMMISKQQPPMFAEGSWDVPQTGPAIIHEGEIVTPKTMADSIRSGDATLGAGNANSGTTVHIHGNVYDERGFTKVLKRSLAVSNIKFQSSGAY
jgi:hypothetical protein